MLQLRHHGPGMRESASHGNATISVLLVDEKPARVLSRDLLHIGAVFGCAAAAWGIVALAVAGVVHA